MKYLVLLLLSLLSFSFFCQKKDTLKKGQNRLDVADAVLLDTSVLLYEEEIVIETEEVLEAIIETVVTVNNELKQGDSTALQEIIMTKYDTLPLSRGVREVLNDSAYWMSIDSFFVRFDSMRVDPYGYDGAKYEDTLCVALFDTLADSNGVKRGGAMPLKRKHYITSKFGFRRYKWHYGTDLRLSIGDSVVSCYDGIVRIAKYNYRGYGNYIIVRHHNGFETLYAHLSKRLVNVGDKVNAGQLIGLGGNTGHSSGPHLHFEVRFRGEAIDPNIMFDFANDSIRKQTFCLTPFHYEYIREMRKRIYYKVKRGDTGSGIASRYYTSWRKICRLNGIRYNSKLRIGQRLRIR